MIFDTVSINSNKAETGAGYSNEGKTPKLTGENNIKDNVATEFGNDGYSYPSKLYFLN